MDFFTFFALFSAAMTQHWASISVVVGFLTGGGALALKNKAYTKFATQALLMAEQVAKMELSDVDKRHMLVDKVYSVMPPWVQHLVTQKAAEDAADVAFAKLP